VAIALIVGRTADADRTASAKCSSFGSSWRRSYNKTAIKSGNPIRILAACCRPASRAGVNHCYITVTLAGTKDRGCETVDIGPDGLPAGPGRHEVCTPRT
jgi:hypothetical protein